MNQAAPRTMRCVSPMLLATLSVMGCAEQPAHDQQSAPTPAAREGPANEENVIRFTDVTAASGIAFVLTSGRRPATQIVEVKGGGLALIDYDNDGLLDLFIPNGATLESPTQGPGCRLFRNLGNLTFRDETKSAGLSFDRWGMGVAVGDANGDGYDDIFIACFGENALLRNNGDGTFTEVTHAAGLDDDQSWSTGCAWSDLDGDGDLDLYVANFLEFDPAHPPPPGMFKGEEVFAGPHGLSPQRDLLYENLGAGTFRNVTQASGCGASDPEYGLNVVILDFDDDHKPDIFVANDSSPNFMYQNRGAMTFGDVGVRSGIASNGGGALQATMGIAIADVNDDATPDVFTSNFSSDTNTLHVNLGGMMFDDRTQLFGLGAVSTTSLGWAAGCFDFNHDGSEDLIVFNGHVYPQATRATMDSDFLQTPLLFERRARRFESVAAQEAGPWLAEAHCDRSAVFGDLDLDGDIDIIVGELNGPVRVLRSDRNGGPWITLELRDLRRGAANRRAIGSVIEFADGARTHRRWIYSGGSFQSSSALAAHVALTSSPPFAVRITWPDGQVSEVEAAAASRAYLAERTDDGVTLRAK